MKVTKEPIEKAGNCNFCQRGTMVKDEIRLEYPYKFVYVFTGKETNGGICGRMCEKCYREFNKQVNQLEKWPTK